jgi:hypothetical protein
MNGDDSLEAGCLVLEERNRFVLIEIDSLEHAHVQLLNEPGAPATRANGADHTPATQ